MTRQKGLIIFIGVLVISAYLSWSMENKRFTELEEITEIESYADTSYGEGDTSSTGRMDGFSPTYTTIRDSYRE